VKNRSFIYHLLFAIIVLFTASSCQKDNESYKVNSALITGKYWEVTSWIIEPPLDVNGEKFTDLYAISLTCITDNLIRFNANGSVTMDEGATKCNADAKQTTVGTWAFNDDETEMNISLNGVIETYSIIELTDALLKYSFLSENDITQPTVAYTNTITMVAQSSAMN